MFLVSIRTLAYILLTKRRSAFTWRELIHDVSIDNFHPFIKSDLQFWFLMNISRVLLFLQNLFYVFVIDSVEQFGYSAHIFL